MKSISTSELAKLLTGTKAIQLIDVRTPLEYGARHIAQAKNVPLDDIDQFDEPKDQTYYVICRSGRRLEQACASLSQKGYTHVIDVQGGMNDWHGPTTAEF